MEQGTIEKLSSKWWRMNHLYKIVDKKSNLVTFKMNEEQTALYSAYATKKTANKQLRDMTLKDRQIGISTFHLIWMLDECLFTKNRNCGCIAHEQSSLEKLFRIVKTAWENMPEALRPKASLENIRELHFPHTNSTIFITLKARSGTLSHLHVSEYALIKDIQELKAGSFQAAGAGDITIEFTGCGINHAYEDWMSESQWSKHFFPWTTHKEYQTKEEWPGKKEHEEYLKLCTPEQKNWWYRKLDELQDIKLLKQEYPLTEDEAFQTTSRGVFSDVLGSVSEATPLETIKEPHLALEIYKQPEEGGQYVLGADPSGGFSDGDYSCFYVLDNRSRQICLRWHGRLDPDQFGREIVRYAAKYNYAFVVPEINNHGLTVVQAMLNDGYTDIYQRQRRDKVTEDITLEWGWNTTAQSKDELIDTIKETLREKTITELPKQLIKELKTFVRKENGRCEAEVGCHDDEVLSLGLALMGVRFRPYYEVTSKRNKYMGR
jgi:predicted small metal-binding protein